jgi:hypothetical protein
VAQVNPFARGTAEECERGEKIRNEAARAEGFSENLHGNLSHGPTSQHTSPAETCKLCRKQ